MDNVVRIGHPNEGVNNVKGGNEHQVEDSKWKKLTFTHTCIKPLLPSRCRVFQNGPPADVHAFPGNFTLYS